MPSRRRPTGKRMDRQWYTLAGSGAMSNTNLGTIIPFEPLGFYGTGEEESPYLTEDCRAKRPFTVLGGHVVGTVFVPESLAGSYFSWLIGVGIANPGGSLQDAPSRANVPSLGSAAGPNHFPALAGPEGAAFFDASASTNSAGYFAFAAKMTARKLGIGDAIYGTTLVHRSQTGGSQMGGALIVRVLIGT